MADSPKLGSLDILHQQQNALLLAEIAAWLHMLGKYHEGFLEGAHDLDIKFPAHEKSGCPDDLRTLLDSRWMSELWNNMGIAGLEQSEIKLLDFIKEHRNRNVKAGLLRLLFDAHGRGSGIEKGILADFAPGQTGQVYSASAAGLESGPIHLRELAERRKHLYDFLIQALSELEKQHGAVDWSTFRTPILTCLEQHFRTTLAETRRPMNDVSLFDQTFATVAMFKAVLAQNLLTRYQDPIDQRLDQKYRWRLLRVGLDSMAYWEQAVRVNDLLSRKQLVEPALNAVRRLLEETYPMGAEVYRDENGSLFVLPDIPDLLSWFAGSKTLRQHLEKIAVQAFAGDVAFTLVFSEATRNLLSFGKLVAADLPEPAPDPERVQSWWQNPSPQDEICSVCGLRPQGPGVKARQRQVCDTCEKRRTERSSTWVEELSKIAQLDEAKRRERPLPWTVWLDETTDEHGRLALIIGEFGLQPWLSGRALDSVLMVDPVNFRGRVDRKELDFTYGKLLAIIEKNIGNADQQFYSLKSDGSEKLHDLFPKKFYRGLVTFRDFFNFFVEDSRNTPIEAWRFALALIHQQPSFARVRRLWETTRRFWREVEGELIPENVQHAGPRLEIRGTLHPEPDPSKPGKPGNYHAYELVLTNGMRLNVVWQDSQSRFITADNLKYLEKLCEAPVKGFISGKCEIQEPMGYGSDRKLWGYITVNSSSPTEVPGNYLPAIPLLAEPRTFMALVPARDALPLIRAIGRKYEREMGKVRNRLPLSLGVVYAQQHTPLRALLDAGRRMLRRARLSDSGWQVYALNDRTLEQAPAHLSDANFTVWRELLLKNGEREIAWRVPLRVGDGTTQDVWYPYALVARPAANQPVEERKRFFYGLDPWNESSGRVSYVHVDELKAGDIVAFTPTTIDFQWLDSSARRFEIAYDQRGRRRSLPRRPYLLEELEKLEEMWAFIKAHLPTKSQIYALRDAIENRRQSWAPEGDDLRPGGVFWQFCRQALVNAKWKEYKWNSVELDRWTEFAVRGWLADVIELHFHILKESL